MIPLNSRPIIIVTQEFQRRKHHKKRINKKWRKRYGVIELNRLPHGHVIITSDCLYMTKRTFEEIKKRAEVRYDSF